MNKKIAAVSCTGVLAAFLCRSHWERRHFVLKKYDISSPKISAPFRFVFLSDLHGAVYGTDNESLVRCIRDVKPDVILIGGDMMVTKPFARMNFRALAQVLRAVNVPVYYAEGNHEQRMKLYPDEYPGWQSAFERLLCTRGVVYLDNETVMLRHDICVSGLSLEEEYYAKFRGSKMPASYAADHLPDLRKMPDGAYSILMAHAPQYMKSYWQSGADMVLAGHFHGGVMTLPFIGSLISPQFGLFPRYARGIYRGPDQKCGIVSAGLGTHSVNIRIFNRPEVVCVNLLPRG